jgi:predicted helicase
VTQKLTKADRGKLIMACGTGKTFTALRIAEAMAPEGHVLFLVPSLSLLSQSLREWTAEAANPIHSLAVCSDVNIGKSRKKADDDTPEITLHDLAFPATTNAKQLVAQYEALRARARKDKSPGQMTVVFSTYQSLEAVSKAQKAGLPEFDLVICDEAHRTTGVTLSGEDESSFVKVHDADFIKGKKRLYMTATPRIYGDEAKTKAKEATAELASMDDPSGIVNDPNDWCREHNEPRYIVDLLKRVVRVSVETMKIVKTLPPLNERQSTPSKPDGAASGPRAAVAATPA